MSYSYASVSQLCCYGKLKHWFFFKKSASVLYNGIPLPPHTILTLPRVYDLLNRASCQTWQSNSESIVCVNCVFITKSTYDFRFYKLARVWTHCFEGVPLNHCCFRWKCPSVPPMMPGRKLASCKSKMMKNPSTGTSKFHKNIRKPAHRKLVGMPPREFDVGLAASRKCPAQMLIAY